MTTTRTTSLDVTGPYDLREVALMGFGHRDERTYDGVLRLAFCAEPDLALPVGVEVRQEGATLALTVHAPAPQPLDDARLAAVATQVARVVSADHDGAAYAALCARDPVLTRLHAAAPGFRPALFHSAYEALVWAVLSARRSRSQAIPLRQRLGEQLGTTVVLAGRPTVAVPVPARLRELESLPGLPADRVPRLHAIAEAAAEGRLDTARLRGLPPEEATAELQRLPGIGPFYASLVVVRALGHADVLAPGESHGRAAVGQLYGLGDGVGAEELGRLAEGWRPFRTWVQVAARAVGVRMAA
ncbi:DNA-3-methyladenine glycosylase II [Friedmanniella luteola]|uniref:DNA-3-methyladenine glycosylase II n=1 Tax=Friedmanniella luteola TaxID=546871 RepID=A0A1H1ZY46_9ACTN|nr:DNA-3-methyladenine glycosylase [Friedmanniella luteola]SDT38166.1 DNA-3-methyladenine glycosylase II [Friedmanniella luteola]